LPIIRFDRTGNLYTVWEDATADGILFSKITGLTAAVKPDAIQSLVASSYPSGKPVRLSWTVPKGMRSTPFVEYLVQMYSGTTDWGFITRNIFYIFDSLPDGSYSYKITASTTIGSSSIGGSFV